MKNNKLQSIDEGMRYIEQLEDAKEENPYKAKAEYWEREHDNLKDDLKKVAKVVAEIAETGYATEESYNAMKPFIND